MNSTSLTRREWRNALLFTVALSASLNFGFLATAGQLFHWVTTTFGWSSAFTLQLERTLAFPLMALFFVISLPSRRKKGRSETWGLLLATGILPILCALIYGEMLARLPFSERWRAPEATWSLAWYVLAVPLGEELLFRGWLYEILSRLWPKNATLTNPLPAAVWLTALAFSLWHAQNFATGSFAFVVFQMKYTFFTGLWLGFLRWKTGGLALPIAFHCLLNLSANIL